MRTWYATTKHLEELGVNGRILQLILNEWDVFFGPPGFNTLRTRSFKLFKRPFPGVLTILTL